MNPDPDYSAAYVIIETEPGGTQGHGFTFTIGRGNEVCVAAIRALAPSLIGRPVEELFENMGLAWRLLTADRQLRWIGPEKGAIHLAKPLWQLLAELPSMQLAASIDFTYLGEVLTPSEAMDLLEDGRRGLAERLAVVKQQGFPAYTTSVGWLGYPDEKVDALCRVAVEDGWNRFKMKVGGDPNREIARAELIRNLIGPDGLLMMDANQRWEVVEAIERIRDLARFDPVWIEEPTSPDDILGHAAIAEAIRPIRARQGSTSTIASCSSNSSKSMGSACVSSMCAGSVG